MISFMLLVYARHKAQQALPYRFKENNLIRQAFFQTIRFRVNLL